MKEAGARSNLTVRAVEDEGGSIFQRLLGSDHQEIPKKWVEWMIKLVIGAVLLFLIYRQLGRASGVAELWEAMVTGLKTNKISILLVCFLLVPVNWYLESRKWQIAASSFEPQSSRQSFFAILCGITLAVITPNRIGEYGGRIVYLKKVNKGKGLIANFICSISQNLITLFLGFWAALFFFKYFNDFSLSYFALVGFVGVVLGALAFTLYFNLSYLTHFSRFLPKIKFFRWLGMHLDFLKDYNSKDLGRILLVSIARYLVFLIQYILILGFFDISPPYWFRIVCISTIFFVQSGIPLPAVLGFIARGEIAILVLGVLGVNELSILAATYSLWILNLMIPALIGLVFLLKVNLIKSFGYGD